MLPTEGLSPEDVHLIGAALDAAVSGPFFPDWEFHTLFGLSRDEVKRVAAGWPDNATEPDTELAVWNSLANLWGYPHGQAEQLRVTLGVDREALRDFTRKLKRLNERGRDLCSADQQR
jgi:hypothetical protein